MANMIWLESIVIAVQGVLILALFAVVAGLRQALRQQNEARAEWWDAYPAALDEAERAHRVIIAQRDAHEELQRAFLHVCSTERVA
jgi:sensor c-di-GMP phosphodiesterase-like protein